MSSFSQLFGKFPYKSSSRVKVIALTFDDGPNQPFSTELLDFFKEKGVRATFFVVGECVKKFPEVTRRAFDDGHVIGNHSLSHKFTKYFTEPSFKNEISANQDIIKGVIGKTPALFRPPWLFRTPLILHSAKSFGLESISGYFGHNFEVLQPSAEKMFKRVLKNSKPGRILIFHDGFDAKGGNRAETVGVVKLLVEALIDDGYRFVTIDELLGIQAYQ